MDHIALIMDGNRRWADREKVSRIRGHKEGIFAIERTIQGCIENSIPYVTLYAFSTENWNRKASELRYLSKLMYHYLKLLLEGRHADWVLNRVRINFVGHKQLFGANNEAHMTSLEELTKDNTECHVIIAVSYAGQDEIVDAANRALASGVKHFSRNVINQHLYLPDVPCPDLVVRTGGDQRLSNFLMWQTAYAELLFVKKLWPEIVSSDFKMFASEYSARDRKFGK